MGPRAIAALAVLVAQGAAAAPSPVRAVEGLAWMAGTWSGEKDAR